MKKGTLFLYNKGMKNLHVINPYSDDSLQYNENTGRYSLTREYCKANYEMTLKNDGVLDREIERNTDNVYDFIDSKTNTNNLQVVKALLTRTQEGRDFILKLLSYQMDANMESGFNSTGKIPLVNAANGQIIAREEVMRNQVSVEVERLLMNSAQYLGVNIFYQGTFPPYFLNLYRGLL